MAFLNIVSWHSYTISSVVAYRTKTQFAKSRAVTGPLAWSLCQVTPALCYLNEGNSKFVSICVLRPELSHRARSLFGLRQLRNCVHVATLSICGDRRNGAYPFI